MAKLSKRLATAAAVGALLTICPTAFAETSQDCLNRFDETLAAFNTDVSPDGQTLACIKHKNLLRLEITGFQECSAFHQTVFIALNGKQKSCHVGRHILSSSCGEPYDDLGTQFINPNKEYSVLVKAVKAMCAEGLQ